MFILDLLVAFIMFPPWLETGPNLIPRPRLVCFFGYPFDTKGYKLYYLASRTCFVSRDVVFKESFFSFKHWTSKSTPIPSFSPSNSVFPPQSVLPKSSSSPVSADFFPLPISAKFTPTFTIDIATPPNEFPNLMPLPSALEQSHSAPNLPVIPHSISPPSPQAQRKSSRAHKAPSYLLDYHYNLASTRVLALAPITQSHDSNASTPSGILYPISSTLSYDRLSFLLLPFPFLFVRSLILMLKSSWILDGKKQCKLSLMLLRLTTLGLCVHFLLARFL